jgi:biopolymer transport protein ExbD
MKLARPIRSRAGISLVAMIDVLMIMLVFFMVTSTYLELAMVPLVEGREAGGAPTAAERGTRIVVRLGGDGVAYVQGRPLAAAELTALIEAARVDDPSLEVIALPSGLAELQSLAALMDAAAAAGAGNLRIVRLEAEP